jgi:hypothetical protein
MVRNAGRELPIANGSFLAAQSPFGLKSFVPARNVPKGDCGPKEFAFIVSEAALRNEQYRTPRHLSDRQFGKHYQLVGRDGKPLGKGRM